MNVLQIRYRSSDRGTLSVLLIEDPDPEVGWRRFGYVCEDPHQDKKIPGNTRIPAGVYEIKLRTEGGMHERYKKRFPSLHVGMLWLQDVPGFEWIYYHVGNKARDTEGCPLVGQDADERTMSVLNSVQGYDRFYSHVASALVVGKRCYTRIIDADSRIFGGVIERRILIDKLRGVADMMEEGI